MMNNIYNDKKRYGYKITSKKLFKAEVEVMTHVIQELNKRNIYVGYIYDAVFCKESEKDEVIIVMNRVVEELNINTTV